jgi:hypothetical protein
MRLLVVRVALLGLLVGCTSAILNGTYSNSELVESPRVRTKIVGSSLRPKVCTMKAATTCENINSTSVGSEKPPTLWCLGTELPYTTVSLDLLPGVTSLLEMLVIL